MFEYVIELLEDIITNCEENICSGLWRLERIKLKQYKNKIKEIQSAIELLKKEGEK